MDTLKLTLLVIFIGIRSVVAQSVSLTEDSVFKAVLGRQMRYPVLAEQTGVYGRVYACFTINERGHVEQVQVLGSGDSKYGFTETVRKGLTALPPLQPRYARQYVLPIDFAYINYNESAEPLLASAQSLPALYQQGRMLLKPVRIMGNSRTYRHNGTLMPSPLHTPERRYY
ncbi:energy transducer TonB [Spirosoma fluminis]